MLLVCFFKVGIRHNRILSSMVKWKKENFSSFLHHFAPIILILILSNPEQTFIETDCGVLVGKIRIVGFLESCQMALQLLRTQFLIRINSFLVKVKSCLFFFFFLSLFFFLLFCLDSCHLFCRILGWNLSHERLI